MVEWGALKLLILYVTSEKQTEVQGNFNPKTAMVAFFEIHLRKTQIS